MNVTKNLLLAIMCCICSVAHAGGELPDRSMTPGAINEALTPSQYLAQCHTKGWTRAYRPAVSYTNGLKRIQMARYGYALADKRDYEEDHLIPLCLGGAPQDPRNLWPQPRFGEWDAEKKDRLESKICRLACDGRVPLRQAQQDMATDWIAAYHKYMGRYRASRESNEDGE